MTDLPARIQEMLDWAEILRKGLFDCCTCLLAREDVPRLIELVGEMAGVLESFRDTDCQRMGCMQCRDDVCLSKLWGRLDDALAKFRGEAKGE